MTDLNHVLIIDDHPLFRNALSSALSSSYPSVIALEVDSIEAAVESLKANKSIDIALLDLNIPNVSGYEGLLTLRALYPRLPVLVVSGLESEQVVKESISCGAAGFLPKSLGREVLETAVSTVMAGDIYYPENKSVTQAGDESTPKEDVVKRIRTLTPQQLRVLFMLKEGLLNKQIAYELEVGATTVKKHVSEILRKLQVHSRTQAVIEISKLDNEKLFDAENQFVK